MLLLSSQVITPSEGAQGTLTFLAHLCKLAALQEAFKKLPPWSNIEFLDYGNAWGEEEAAGTSEAAWKPQKENRLFCSFEGCDCETGLINRIPSSHVKYLDKS